MPKTLPRHLRKQYYALLDRMIEQDELSLTAPTQKEKDFAKARASATRHAVKQFMDILTALGYSLEVPNNSSSGSSSGSSLTSFSSSGSHSSSGSNTHKKKTAAKKGGSRIKRNHRTRKTHFSRSPQTIEKPKSAGSAVERSSSR